jgi:antitoxin FitA
MPEIVLTDVPALVISELHRRAAAFHRTPAEEAKSILSEALTHRPLADWANVDAIYNRLSASGRKFADSADLLREDRER